MPTQRDARPNAPYSQFNFQVSWNGGADALNATETRAGFQEVSGIGVEFTVAEYRAGNHNHNSPIKINGLHKVPDVTLKRGVMGFDDFYAWVTNIKEGSPSDRRNIVIELMSEDRSGPVMSWELKEARPIKYTGPSLNGKGTDIAIEELTLACERIVFEGQQA
jgi:phage tail-like protein